MESFKTQNYLCGVEPYPLLGELEFASQVIEELATIEEVHDHVEFVLRLEGVVHLHEERRLHMLQHVALRLRVVDLIPLQQVRLLEHLHRKVLMVRLVWCLGLGHM